MKSIQLDNFFKQLEVIQKAKESLQNSVIEWETDLNKIDLSVLRSQTGINLDDEFQKVWIDKLDVVDKSKSIDEFHDIEMWQLKRDFFKDKATLELIEFIEKGNKLIPPLYIKPLYFCGETFSYSQIHDVYRSDGGHRLFVSQFVSLNEIPIIMAERVTRFSFPVDKWEFEYTDDNFKAKSKLNSLVIELKTTLCTNVCELDMVDNLLVITR